MKTYRPLAQWMPMVARAYSDANAAEYELQHAHFWTRFGEAPRQHFVEVLRRIGEKRNWERLRVLDVGCAGGRDIIYFLSHGLDADGFDLSEGLVRIAREVRGLGSHVEQGDLLGVTLDDQARYHGVWSAFVLHHLPPGALVQAIQRLRACLVEGGLLFLIIKERAQGMPDTAIELGAAARPSGVRETLSGVPRPYTLWTLSQWTEQLDHARLDLLYVNRVPSEVTGSRPVRTQAQVARQTDS